ncbi:MAG: HD domain-containing phosphohydrolase, partial [Termitinemataceae bacterium]
QRLRRPGVTADLCQKRKIDLITGNMVQERNIDILLRRILEISQHITGADAGSIFLVDNQAQQPLLRFKYSNNYSLQARQYEEFTIPQTKTSIAGYVSLTGETLNIPDVYQIPMDALYSFNKSFDEKTGYRTRSMLTVPMKDHTNSIVGVIQLINSKEKDHQGCQDPDSIMLQNLDDIDSYVVPFKKRYEALLEAVASQAAIALENAQMIDRIQHQFEQFVLAAVEAVEQRDPATSGHSYRVSMNAVKLARFINDQDEQNGYPCRFSETDIKELELAGLLHDFGKVYIDPAIFLKAQKLYPEDFEKLQLRLKYLRRSLELDFALRESHMEPAALDRLNKERDSTIRELIEISKLIENLNLPTITDIDPEDIIKRILSTPLPPVRGVDNEPIPILTPEEIENLTIKRGSLNPKERKEIEAHVIRSYEFTRKIPWPPEYRHIPDYIKVHHEMLDGSGYPEGLTGESIPLQGRILAVVDIFDALTAADRPYKKAVPVERALQILDDEARRGRLDITLVQYLHHLVGTYD